MHPPLKLSSGQHLSLSDSQVCGATPLYGPQDQVDFLC